MRHNQISNQLVDALKYIRERTSEGGEAGPNKHRMSDQRKAGLPADQRKAGIVLGTGLSGLAKAIDVNCEIPYTDIPHFPQATVQSHAGKLIFGRLSEKEVVAMAGRFHYYEGYSMQQVTFPIRVMAALGVDQLILSNAAGGLQAHYEEGDIVLLKDHINLLPEHPLRGPNDQHLGARFPDMLHAYDPLLRASAKAVAQRLAYRVHEGVYAALQGPSLETPAEYAFLHHIGADLVGMSTVPEVIVARHMQLPVLAASIVSNVCYPTESLTPTTVEQVIETVERASPRLEELVRVYLEK